MDEEKEPIALGFWTRESKKVIEWSQILVNRNIKFNMSAYNEGMYTRQYVYTFRLEELPDQNEINHLKERGFEHAFFIYKGVDNE